MKYEFIDRHRRQFHLSAMCRVLHVSRSGFYEWQGRTPSARTIANQQLLILLDLYSRKVVGWSMGDRPNEALTLGALNMAIEHRIPKPGLIHHTD